MASRPPDPLFPDVPQTPGVPPVFRDPTAAFTHEEQHAMTRDAPQVQETSPPWGLYLFPGGKSALECDNVMVMEPGREARIADYPVEGGGFQNYNKTLTPGEIRVTVTKGGTVDDRTAFMGVLNNLLESTDLFNVIAPDFAGINYNLTRYDFRRSAEAGAGLLTVELSCQEVRETAEVTFTDTKEPSGAEPVNGGPVQPTTPTPDQAPVPASTPSANPEVAVIPSVPSGASYIDKAHTVSAVIAAGGTINDLASKGVDFLSVPTLVTPAQSLTTTLAGQSVRLDIMQKAFGLFTDVYVNGALVIGGVKAEADNPVVRSAYLGFLGDLYFHDIRNAGDGAQPSFEELGSRFALLFAGA